MYDDDNNSIGLKFSDMLSSQGFGGGLQALTPIGNWGTLETGIYGSQVLCCSSSREERRGGTDSMKRAYMNSSIGEVVGVVRMEGEEGETVLEGEEAVAMVMVVGVGKSHGVRVSHK